MRRAASRLESWSAGSRSPGSWGGPSCGYPLAGSKPSCCGGFALPKAPQRLRHAGTRAQCGGHGMGARLSALPWRVEAHLAPPGAHSQCARPLAGTLVVAQRAGPAQVAHPHRNSQSSAEAWAGDAALHRALDRAWCTHNPSVPPALTPGPGQRGGTPAKKHISCPRNGGGAGGSSARTSSVAFSPLPLEREDTLALWLPFRVLVLAAAAAAAGCCSRGSRKASMREGYAGRGGALGGRGRSRSCRIAQSLFRNGASMQTLGMQLLELSRPTLAGVRPKLG